MTIKNAINLFNRLVSETAKKSEIRLYKDFIRVLSDLESRSFTQSEFQSVEAELDALALNNAKPNNKKYFHKALQRFKKYLKDTHSLITKGYYTNPGITLGATTGLLLGIIFLSGLERSIGISIGISIGALVGIIIAGYLESQAKASGNLI